MLCILKLKLQCSFLDINFISKKSVCYIDLSCIATIYLLVVISFRVFCMVDLKIGVFIFL